MSENGKGDKQRPVDRKKYAENYEKIFSKKQAYDLIFKKGKK